MKIVTRMVTPKHEFPVILSEACPSEASFLMGTFLELVVELVAESIVPAPAGQNTQTPTPAG